VPVDILTNPIPETAGDETASESANEPLTPVSGRQSRDFYSIAHYDSTSHAPSEISSQDIAYSEIPGDSGLPVHHVTSHIKPPPLVLEPLPTPPETLSRVPRLQPPALRTAKSLNCLPVFTSSGSRTTPTAASPALASPLQDPPSAPPRRQANGGNGRSLTRKPSRLYRMASFFRRSTSNVPELDSPPDSTAGATPVGMRTPASSSTPRRFSLHRSTATTRSNTPPSPGSPVEAKGDGLHPPMASSVPSANDFLNKKARANTGFSFRGRVNFAVNHRKEAPRRTRSVERNKKPRGDVHLTPQPWALAPDAGTGMKARRLSLSLPDDFNVDVVDLMRDYEYQHKLLGRHGKHLGKGATSKVTLMARKGSPSELYAVKEFRGRKAGETAGDYEKKIKSEYSIAKSLHHPNIVETINLCTHHGRWNHVMEYCAEGDLFGLVSKKYLNDPQHESDRLCLFKQLVQGVNYLHSNGIAHRDIKLENLLITKDSKLKITDFGVSEVFTGIHPGLRESGGECGRDMGEVRLCKPAICGSLPYIAPEVLSKTADYDPRALDVWSSAIVMMYLIFGGNLWEKAEVDANSKGSQYNALVRGWEGLDRARAETPDSHEKSYPQVLAFERCVKPLTLRKILLNMLHPDPEKRMTITQVANHRFTKAIECCQRESYDGPSVLIDASKADCMKNVSNVQFCHNHLPPQNHGGGLPPMPGKAGY
jgi:protein-serine/threonine kinase